MAVDWQRYLDNTRPLNLLKLMDDDVLVHLLNGFSLAIGAGVSVLFATQEPVTEDSLDRRDAKRTGEEAGTLFRPFCQQYRNHRPYNQKCLMFDRQMAMKYWTAEWTGPMLYRCHMQLWDMTFPLMVNGRRLGVLFAGQIVVKGEVDWKQVLSAEGIPVACETLDPESRAQEEDILDCIVRRTEDPHASKLLEILDGVPKEDRPDVGRLIEIWRDFCAFGRMMETLLRKLYTLTEGEAKEELLGQIGVELIQHATSAQDWAKALSDVLARFHEATGVGPIEVYSREGSHYVQRVSRAGAGGRGQALRVAVRMCVELPPEELTSIDHLPNAEEVRGSFGVGSGVSLYRSDLPGLQQRSISTILAVHSGVHEEAKREFARRFCHRVGLRAALTELLFQIVADRKSFDDRVRRAAHSSKTPLQTALTDIELALDLAPEGPAEDVLSCLGRVKERIAESSTEVSEMIFPTVRPRHVVDLRELLKQLAAELEPLGAKRNCSISLALPDRPVRCRVSEPEIRVALRNLLDNAIKYSFAGHDVRVRLEVVAGRTARVVFHNFGVGIPEERLNEIREMGERGGVADPKAEKKGRSRPGSGLGLWIAIQDVETHGGSLNVDSRPADPGPRDPHLRYVTTVTVTLPLVEV